MVFSTAKFLVQFDFDISHRQFGLEKKKPIKDQFIRKSYHVVCSSFNLQSANKWLKQDAHMRCPLTHFREEKFKGKTREFEWIIFEILDT